jgi:hypothetical protein
VVIAACITIPQVICKHEHQCMSSWRKINQLVHLNFYAEPSGDEHALLKEDGKQDDHDTEESHQKNALI